ncbi:MAG: amidohydrolase family protein, partial [Isosphaeraceae bacterium]
MRHDRVGLLAAWIVMSVWATAGRAEGPVKADWVLKGGLVVDGTGTPGKRLDVAIQGDRIVALGEFEADPSAKQIDASAWVVAPGFIDLHSHSDGSIVNARTKANRNYVTQGVTTVVTGNCGSGPIDVAAYFRKIEDGGVGTNIIHLVPHGSVRRKVMGNANRKADDHALEQMRTLVEQGMDAGAWGMSTGLIYLPGRYADTAELIDLAKVVAKHGGIYASHMRNEGGGLLNSIDETITIGREAGVPVQISHLKASGEKNWGLVVPAIARIKAARDAGQVVTADQYPYIASSTSLAAMVVPEWARRDGADGFSKLADDPEQGKRLRTAIAENLGERDGGARIRIARYSRTPSRVGRDLAAIAKAESTTPLDVVIDIERHGGAQAISFSMSEDDVRRVMVEPFVATASDGSAHLPGADRPHPRAYGTFPRKIRYALDDKVMSLEQAIRSCSGLPAEILGLPERGVIRVGSYADIVVFDPKTFRDASTFDDPTQYAPGVMYLFVNGVPEVADGQYRKVLAGRVLRRQAEGKADLIIKVGRIWTGDAEAPWAEALAVRGGRIIAVGKADALTRFQGAKTRVFDRNNAFATPGLVDAHGHITSLGSAADELELRGVDNPEAVAERVKQWIADRPDGDWVIGNNFDQSLWPGGQFASSAVLDAVAPDRPVWLIRVDGHAGWANSEAMRRAGVNAETQSPPDGQILKDEHSRPLGVFVDGAMRLINSVTPRTTREDTIRR